VKLLKKKALQGWGSVLFSSNLHPQPSKEAGAKGQKGRLSISHQEKFGGVA
jgi:hypothetical protein